jgi:hypothetical protein
LNEGLIKPLTRDQRKLVEAAVTIFGESATGENAAFMARELVQVTLPHSDPKTDIWSRTNGNLSLGIQAGFNLGTGKKYGLPYGTIPRLLLFWITTEAIKTKSRRLELGKSLNGFMHELGLNPDNGSLGAKRSDARRLREQMDRLFQAKISFQRHEQDGNRSRHAWMNMDVAPDGELWWNERSPSQTALWGSWIELGEKFFQAVTSAPVPIDIRALRALKRSPLALDLYAWLTYEAYRAHRAGKPRYEAWGQLHAHMGGEYADMNNFRKKVRAALNKIGLVYPALKLGTKQGGIEVLPESYPALLPRDLTIDGLCKTL